MDEQKRDSFLATLIHANTVGGHEKSLAKILEKNSKNIKLVVN
ncbi:hypothetical protein [Liquorilactobacillus nagelii]